MTEQDQRIAIAEVCGWCHYFDGVANWWSNKWMVIGGVREDHLPNYPADLNAMHEAENTLSPEQKENYGLEMARIFGCCEPQDVEEQFFNCIHATAAQRAEAFLRTIGKWKD